MVGLLRRSFPLLTAVAAVAALSWVPPRAAACPFCTMQGQTLVGEVGQASMVLYGTFTNANEQAETTDLVIDAVIKDHAARKNHKTLTLGKYVPPPPDKSKVKYLVFCDIFKDKIDPYRGVPVKPNSPLPLYLKKALVVKDKPIAQRLRFFFDYLDSDDLEVSNDAYKEFGNADYKDYEGMAKDLPAGRVVKWLGDENTPQFRLGLYASMLGHCGKPKDAKVLLDLLENHEKRVSSGIDGILAGYTMLKPKEGWEYLQATLKDAKKEFMLRYAALRAVRFLHDSRADLVSKKELVEGVCLLLDQDDIADLAIEDLRKWNHWDKLDRVLAVRKSAAYKLPIVQRAVLRFCLSCKGNAKAAAYVAERRKEDADSVKEAEELLELEQEPAKPAKPTK